MKENNFGGDKMTLMHKDHSEESDVKTCPECGTVLHELYQHKLCPLCMERNLFSEVKEYIRNNDVREQDVAEHFNISISKVRGWIREGRIQYKGDSKDTISGVNCRFCGKPIAFGTTCAECHHLQDLQIVANLKKTDRNKMHFIGQEPQNN